MNAIMDNILTRRSVRSFVSGKKIPQDVLRDIVASGNGIRTHRKGDFLALFRDRSGAVRRYSIPHARKKSSKNALFSVLRIFSEKKSPSYGSVFARQTTEIVLDRTLMGV